MYLLLSSIIYKSRCRLYVTEFLQHSKVSTILTFQLRNKTLKEADFKALSKICSSWQMLPSFHRQEAETIQ